MAKVKAHYEYYKDSQLQWRWRLMTDNGNIMADSAEGYKTKQGVEKALASFTKMAQDAEIVEQEELADAE
jgi:uncharacterized protein YegP (UPF0339 family)